jgi:predicted GIY-YIG superfamily endonuclease
MNLSTDENISMIRSFVSSLHPSTVSLHILNCLKEFEDGQKSPSSLSTTTQQQYVYTLKLQNGCYYVGSSTNPTKRFEHHQLGEGCAWTRLHHPEGIIRAKKVDGGDIGQARIDEDAEVKRLVRLYGVDKVRGGSYSKANLSKFELRVFKRELWHCEDACLRCGRMNHWANNCTAHDDVHGKVISREHAFFNDEATANEVLGEEEMDVMYKDKKTQAPIFPLNSCGICGHSDHLDAKQCTAVKDVNEQYIDFESRKWPIKKRSIHDDYISNKQSKKGVPKEKTVVDLTQQAAESEECVASCVVDLCDD